MRSVTCMPRRLTTEDTEGTEEGMYSVYVFTSVSPVSSVVYNGFL
jgi:hypothetical protein